MARVDEYRNYIEQIIREFGSYKPSYGEIEIEMVFDREHDHYELLNVGWQGDERISGAVLHIDIKGEKIWIQHDGTEIGVANELVAMGVPKENIVLAYHAPYKRKYSGFAEK